MEYQDIPTHLRQYLAADENEFDILPENFQNMLLAQAARSYQIHGMSIAVISESLHIDDRDIYLHNEIPSIMNIIDHRYVLKENHPPPNRSQFMECVNYYLRSLSTMSRYRIRNVTFCYNTNYGGIQWFSFSRRNVESIGLERLIEHIIVGEEGWDADFYGGSDYIKDYMNRRTLNTSTFSIITELIQGGMGDEIVEYDYYKCIRMKNNINDCLIKCFQYLSVNDSMTPSEIRELLYVGTGSMLMVDHIPMLEDIFGIDVCVYEDRRIVEFRYKSGEHYYDHRAIIKKDHPVVLYGDINSPHKILWKDDHYSVIDEEYMARNCHCEYTGIFVGHNKSLSKEEVIEILYKQGKIDTDESTIGGDDRDTYYYFFDYETVYSPGSMELMPYAWAVVKYDDSGNKMKEWHDITSNPEAFMSSIMAVIIKEAPSKNERKYLIGFNNSRFDNFMLLKQCQRSNVNVGNVFFAGNSILSLNIKGFVVRDLCRILCTSLKDACDNFGCDIGKGVLDHSKIQEQFLRGEQFDERLIKDYVIRDCTSLGELFFKVRKEFRYLTSFNIESFNTIASMSYKAFTEQTIVDKYSFPILDNTSNHFVRESIYGGRSQIFIPCQETNHVLVCIDCTSLYPYVMLNRVYPIGQPIVTNKYAHGKIGVYKVVITKQPKRKIAPFRSSDKPLDWNHGDSFECVLNSVDIESIWKYDGECHVKVGYYWEECRGDIFENYFKPIVKEKKHQDEIKKKPGYNASLREACKLFLNCLSGKLQQRVFDDVIELITNAGDVSKFHKKVMHDTDTYTPLGEWFIAKGDKINIRPKMPTIWGSLILSYARGYMYDSILSKVDTIYGMDTDSAFIRESDIPHNLIGVELGEFKEELLEYMEDGDKGPYGIFIAPKCYCFYRVSSDGQEIPIKMRFKGVNIAKDKIVTDVKEILSLDIHALHGLYWGSTNVITIDTFRQLLNNKIYILCSSLEKKITDDKAMRSLNIRQRFLIKEITPSNIDGTIIDF